MEALGDGEWDSFTRMFSADQVLDCALGQNVDNFCISSSLEDNNMSIAESSLDALNSSLHYILQESDQQSGFVPSSSCYFNGPLADMTMDMPELNVEDDRLKTQGTRKRRPQDPKHVQKSPKKLNANGSDVEESNAGQEGKSSSSCCSEDDIASAPALSGKARATATGPQSLYARKRREKINERLKILQNLVPNGTKVDISTMLEEAVHYVKFLELQIKLLSSDNMWMYSPIASYNGMDIGHDQP